jgi:hypothetical protein
VARLALDPVHVEVLEIVKREARGGVREAVPVIVNRPHSLDQLSLLGVVREHEVEGVDEL